MSGINAIPIRADQCRKQITIAFVLFLLQLSYCKTSGTDYYDLVYIHIPAICLINLAYATDVVHTLTVYSP